MDAIETLSAILRLHPGAIRSAILLRGIEVLEAAPTPDLTGTCVLLLTGERDPYGRLAPPLEASLTAAGADLDTRVIAAGYELSAQDLDIAKEWLGERRQGCVLTPQERTGRERG